MTKMFISRCQARKVMKRDTGLYLSLLANKEIQPSNHFQTCYLVSSEAEGPCSHVFAGRQEK